MNPLQWSVEIWGFPGNNNHFYNIESIHPNVVGTASGGINIGAGSSSIAESGVVLVAGNRFNESDIDYSYLSANGVPLYAVYNQFKSEKNNMVPCYKFEASPYGRNREKMLQNCDIHKSLYDEARKYGWNRTENK